MNFLVRELLKSWARTVKAPGYLYQVVDLYGHRFSKSPLKRKLTLGASMELDLNDHVARQIYYFGAYEPIDAYLFFNLAKPGDVFIDAGTNIGFYSIMMAKKVAPNGKVHSFEPIPQNYDLFLRNVELSKVNSNIQKIPKALWNKEEILSFSRAKTETRNDGQFTAGHIENKSEESDIQCETIRLDNYVKENNLTQINFIKMDIEGSELNALKGAYETLSRFKPLILLEVCRETCERFGYTPEDLWSYLKQFEYKIWTSGTNPSSSRHLENFDKIDQKNVFLYHGKFPSHVLEQWDYKEIKRFFARN